MTPNRERDALIPTVEDSDATEVPERAVAWDIVDQWGEESFPASDPPANW